MSSRRLTAEAISNNGRRNLAQAQGPKAVML